MECVKECSFWTWSPWTDCFNQCECTNPPEYYDVSMMVRSNFQNAQAVIWKATGKNWESTAGYDWQWLGVDGNKAIIESYMGGETQKTECPSKEECYEPTEDEQVQIDFINLRREIRSSASAIFASQTGQEGPFSLEREARHDGRAFVTLAGDNEKQVFEVEYDEDYPHSYWVYTKTGENKTEYPIGIYAQDDGSLTGVIADSETYVFTDAFRVTTDRDEDTLAGYTFTVESIQLLPDLVEYFDYIRESSLKQAGLYEEWIKTHSAEDDFKNVGVKEETKEQSVPTSATSPEIIFEGDQDQIYLPDEEDKTTLEITTQMNPIIILPDEEDLNNGPDYRKPINSTSSITFNNYTVENDDGSVTYVTVASTVQTDEFKPSLRELEYN